MPRKPPKFRVYDTQAQFCAGEGIHLAAAKRAKAENCPYVKSGGRFDSRAAAWIREQGWGKNSVIDRRSEIESCGKDFIRSYIALCESVPFLRQNDWECVIVALLNAIDSQMETLVICLNPDLAVDPKEKYVGERLRAEPWPLTGERASAQPRDTRTRQKTAPMRMGQLRFKG
jgi:hypothetical protein